MSVKSWKKPVTPAAPEPLAAEPLGEVMTPTAKYICFICPPGKHTSSTVEEAIDHAVKDHQYPREKAEGWAGHVSAKNEEVVVTTYIDQHGVAVLEKRETLQ